MIFQKRADLGEIVNGGVLDPEDRVRIAHAHDRRRVQDRRAGRADLELDGARIGERFGERYLVPAQARLAHIDGVEAAVGKPARNQSALGLERQGRLTGLFADQSRDTAHAVAASAGLRAVIVIDADHGAGLAVGLGARRVKHHELIVRLLPRRRLRFGRRDRARCATWRAQIDDDDLVAEAVHLDVIPVRQRAHSRMPKWPNAKTVQCRYPKNRD